MKWAETYNRLLDTIPTESSLIVAFSGGVDSSLVLKACVDRVGSSHVIAATGISAALADRERRQAQGIADEIGVLHREIPTHEIDRSAYRANGTDRCFHCKSELYGILNALRKAYPGSVILNGANVDDLADHRPGMKAATEANVLSPLIAAGLTKADVRQVARLVGLSNWNKAAAPCLASRIPHHTPVSAQRLARVESAEDALYELGFRSFRVRDLEECARLEIADDEWYRLADAELRAEVLRRVSTAGYSRVVLDMRGLVSGSMTRSALESARAHS